jgi:hypothetical protein
MRFSLMDYTWENGMAQARLEHKAVNQKGIWPSYMRFSLMDYTWENGMAQARLEQKAVNKKRIAQIPSYMQIRKLHCPQPGIQRGFEVKA